MENGGNNWKPLGFTDAGMQNGDKKRAGWGKALFINYRPSLDDYFIKFGSWITFEQWINPLSGFGLGGAGMHGHESIIAFVLYNSGVAAPLHWLEKPPTDETLMF